MHVIVEGKKFEVVQVRAQNTVEVYWVGVPPNGYGGRFGVLEPFDGGGFKDELTVVDVEQRDYAANADLIRKVVAAAGYRVRSRPLAK